MISSGRRLVSRHPGHHVRDIQYVDAHSFVKEGGYVLHASSNRDCTKIYQNVGGRSTEVGMAYENVQAGRLYYSRLTLETTGIVADYF